MNLFKAFQLIYHGQRLLHEHRIVRELLAASRRLHIDVETLRLSLGFVGFYRESVDEFDLGVVHGLHLLPYSSWIDPKCLEKISSHKEHRSPDHAGKVGFTVFARPEVVVVGPGGFDLLGDLIATVFLDRLGSGH